MYNLYFIILTVGGRLKEYFPMLGTVVRIYVFLKERNSLYKR